MKLCIVIAFSFLFAAGCAPDPVDQSPIDARFFLRYVAEGQDIKAQATFLQKDSADRHQVIPMPGGVAFQGSGMGKKLVTDRITRYQYENAGTFPEEFRFACRLEADDDWTEFKSSMIPLSRFRLDDSLTVGEGATLVLPDGPLTASEKLVIIFTNAESEAYPVEMEGPSEGNAMRLAADKLTDLTPGEYTYYLVKKSLQRDTIPPFRALIEAEYYSSLARLTVLSGTE